MIEMLNDDHHFFRNCIYVSLFSSLLTLTLIIYDTIVRVCVCVCLPSRGVQYSTVQYSTVG